MKSLVLRTFKKKEKLQPAIAAWRNMAREDGASPLDLFFGRRQRHRLPMPTGIKHLRKSIEARDRAHARSTENRNKGTKQLSTITTDKPALLLDAHSGKWDKRVIIKLVNPSGLSYMVEDQAGNL